MKNDDLYYKDEVAKPDYILEGQQFERGFPRQPTPTDIFQEGPGRNVQPPRGAPPRFTPTMPDGRNEQPFSNNQSAAEPFGRDGRGQQRNIRQCLNSFTFIWLINGNSFWFYPIFVGRQHVEGFRWRQGRWEYDRINLRSIIFFSCF